MARSNFTPEAAISQAGEASASSSSPKRNFQPTLFNVKFGAERSRLPPSKSAPSLQHGKRTRSQSTQDSEEDAKQEDESILKRPKQNSHRSSTSAAPKFHHRGPFHQVTRADFCEPHRVEGLPDSEIYYKQDFIDPILAEEWRQELDSLSEWYRPKLKVYGKEITQSREIAAYATAPGLHLNYSGHPVEIHSPFPPLLNHIASLLSSDDCLGSEVRFNHCMLNRYDDGSIYIGRHSDNIENKVIVTVSLGADRSWIMERKIPRGKKEELKDEPKTKKRWTLANGSLLVMQGQTQKHYTHEIPKELRVKGARISITFRQLVYDK